MKEYCRIELGHPTPLVTAAIHDGHHIRENLIGLSGLSDSERLREEDPYTGVWAELSPNQIIGQHSRFEFDLNRPPDKAIYRVPSDAWGLNVWEQEPSRQMLDHSRQIYQDIYQEIKDKVSQLVQRVGIVVILDIHSYNHRRQGPDAPEDDPELNPEINVGTGTMDRDFWATLVDGFITDLSGFDYMGRHLDVRENIKFKGGYFPSFIHRHFKESVCCISVEMKKFFMDEWSGKPDWPQIDAIGQALKSTLPGIREEISLRQMNLNKDPKVL